MKAEIIVYENKVYVLDFDKMEIRECIENE